MAGGGLSQSERATVIVQIKIVAIIFPSERSSALTTSMETNVCGESILCVLL